MPVTKYFCRKGYTTRIGTVEMTVIEQRMVMGVVVVVLLRASADVLAALALYWVVASFIFSRYCRLYSSFFVPL